MITQMTLRQIPDAVEKELRAKSRRSGFSINRTAIDLLETALGFKPVERKKRDLSAFAGTWPETAHKEFERNSAIFENNDSHFSAVPGLIVIAPGLDREPPVLA